MTIRLFALIGLFINLYTCTKLKDCPDPYSTCNLEKEGYINVHIVPHTHDDVGWLKTVDQYYYGSSNDYQLASVQYILDTVIPELQSDPNKRFVYVEMAFFWRWWNQQNDQTKLVVRGLVKEGRLEFVIGAWCMNDEATTYYNDMIDQQHLGFKFILEEFGECARPRAAWQIDPFGHSREQASLFAQFGFDGLFLGRVDYQDFEQRGKMRTREMVWQASENLGQQASIFTGVLPYGYNPPPNFCFDIYCNDDPIMDDPSLEDYNVDKKVDEFINYTLNQRQQYKTDNLIMTMGSDFQYSNAHMWFKNLDKLIHYVNERQTTNSSKVNIFYSTTACYLYSLYKSNTTWPTKSDDFFPYAHRPHAFWTGYFTSRTALKLYVRRANNYLQVVRNLIAMADLNDNATKTSLFTLERAMGVAQHHDAVSGTEKQHVAFDYAKRLADGINKCLMVLNNALVKFGLSNNGQTFVDCPLANISQCETSENNRKFTILIYNPLPRPIQKYIRIPTVTNDYQIYQSSSLIEVDYALVYDETKSIPERHSKANYDLIFKANLPATGFVTYTATAPSSVTPNTNLNKESHVKKTKFNENFAIRNEYLQLIFDSNGNLIEIDNMDTEISTALSQSYCVYQSMPGNNSKPEFHASGAYVFRPLVSSCNPLSVKQYSLYRGSQYAELHQVFNDWISQTIRLYSDVKHVEFEWQVGPIPADKENKIGQEIVIKFDTDINSDSLFYTDSNGREMLQRKRDYRPTWNLNQTEKIAGNYYPINSRIFIKDEGEGHNRQLTLVTDRSHGGSSIQDGSIEVMLHRRTLCDDALGVGEPLNEKGSDGKPMIAKGVISLIFNTTSQSARLHRELAHHINNRPLLLFSNESVNSISNLIDLPQISLPSNLHLLTFLKEIGSPTNSYIVRIEHFYEKDEDSLLSQPVTINLEQVFSNLFKLKAVQELALGANMDVDELNNRLKWNTNNFFKDQSSKTSNGKSIFDYEFTFETMQIRTFRLFI